MVFLTYSNDIYYRTANTFGVSYDYSNQTIWENVKQRKFLDIGKYPNDVSSFKPMLTDLKNMYQLKDNFIFEAQRR